jgi:hypothetical protein
MVKRKIAFGKKAGLGKEAGTKARRHEGKPTLEKERGELAGAGEPFDFAQDRQ